MKSDFDVASPSIKQVQTLIKDGKAVEVKLLSGDLLSGKLLWQDQTCVCMTDTSEQSITIWRQAIAFIKTKS
jgi:host factor-I protein